MEGQGVEFAIDAHGGIVAIGAARKGMPKGTYLCAECKQAVYKTEGSINRHHFRHWTDHRGAASVDCGATRESIEHLVGKLHLHKLLELRRVRALELKVQCGGVQDAGTPHSCSTRVKVEYRLPDYDEVAIENVLPGGMKPDVTLLWNGAPVLAIEVFVTHEVTYPKEVAYAELGLPWLELAATSRHAERDVALVHRRDSRGLEARCTSCGTLAEQRHAAKRAEQERREAVRQEKLRRAAFDARKVFFARLNDRPVLPAWARAGRTYTCPVCAGPVTFSAADGAFLHEHPTECSHDTAKRVVAALKLRRLLLRAEPLKYSVRCSGSSMSGASWVRCARSTEVRFEVPTHDDLVANQDGLLAVKDGAAVWQAVLTPGLALDGVPSLRVSADDLLADGFPGAWKTPPAWWCVDCRGSQDESPVLHGTRGMYGGGANDDEHLAQFRHNHRLAGGLLDEVGVDLRHLKGMAVAIAPCTAGCGNDVVRVHPRQGRELARSLHRLVRIEHARGFARPEYRPQCHRCGASQDNSPFAFVLDVSAIRHFSAEDRRRPPSPS